MTYDHTKTMKDFLNNDKSNIIDILQKHNQKVTEFRIIYALTNERVDDHCGDEEESPLYAGYITSQVKCIDKTTGDQGWISIDGDFYSDTNDINKMEREYDVYFERGYEWIHHSDNLTFISNDVEIREELDSLLSELAVTVHNASDNIIKDSNIVLSIVQE